ncbi:hypothetical protein DFJ73DRAFT_855980 [Zopfochytrium polystomum]|nr:hypothetical protein DFJ73DRAFT_855980 [Zopfochytrium polystomum]
MTSTTHEYAVVASPALVSAAVGLLRRPESIPGISGVVAEALPLVSHVIEPIALIGVIVVAWFALRRKEMVFFGTDQKHYRPNAEAGTTVGLLLTPFVMMTLFLSIRDRAVAQYFQLLLDISLLLAPIKGFIARAHQSLVERVIGLGVFACAASGIWFLVESKFVAVAVMMGSILAYWMILPSLLCRLQKSFSAGEALVLSDIAVLLLVDAVISTLAQLAPSVLPSRIGLRQRHAIHTFMHVLIFGMLFIGVVLHPLLRAVRSASSTEGQEKRHIHLSLAFFAAAAGIVAFIIRPWTALLLGGKEPFLWRAVRYFLLAYWSGAIYLGVEGAIRYLSLFGSSKAPGPSSALNMRRKYFHAMAVLMFVPGYILDAELMHLAFSVSISALIMIEYVRAFRVWPVGAEIHSFLQQFVDKWDQGPVVLSHLYLLLGCALPVWLNRIPDKTFRAGLGGIIVLGIGDSMASIVGYRIGKTKWLNSSKSVEGTVAFCTSVFLCFMMMDFTLRGVAQLLFVSVMTGLFEAFSDQNDNLVIPLFSVALFNLF